MLFFSCSLFSYVRSEFKLHKEAKPQHLQGFFTQWIQCKQTNTTNEEADHKHNQMQGVT